ncbi:MAG: 4-hydroxy-tetrahydrodipicolinate synthase [Actinomycetaceae bacterium]|nr:4-hydroxy-tetrahydrodipicolinate synthase [Actinomycetaceae bacterium]
MVVNSSTLPARTFGSVAVAMVTPFHVDGSLDLESAAKVAAKLVADGCDSLVISGTTGEAPTTHQPEKDDLVVTVKETVGDKAFIVAGASSNDTAHAVRMAVSAQKSGAQGLLVVSPYYNRPSQEGLYRHVMAIVEATDLPIMLYDIPGRTGLAFGDETLDRLAEHPRILAVKDATGDVPQGFERMNRTGMAYYSGDDGLNFAWLAHGASGVVSVVGHVVASAYAEMVDEVDRGDLVGARRVANKTRKIVQAIMGGGQGAVMVKHALHLMGVIETPTVRLPLAPASEDEIKQLQAVLEEYELL